MRSKPDIASEVAGLSDLSRSELGDQWRNIYGVSPPKAIRQELMIRAIAWHLQAKRLGALSAETRRLLRSAISSVESEMLARDNHAIAVGTAERKVPHAHDDEAGMDLSSDVVSVPQRRQRPAPGARLLREWNGKTHVVDVIEEGFVFQAKVHTSLTAIAQQITGAHWSGPRFFGL